MATITVSASDLEEKFASDGGITVQSIDWSLHSGDPKFSFSVDEDFVYDDPDFIEIEEYNELQTENEQLQLKLEEVQKELDDTKLQLETLQSNQKFSWKFWQ